MLRIFPDKWPRSFPTLIVLNILAKFQQNPYSGSSGSPGKVADGLLTDHQFQPSNDVENCYRPNNYICNMGGGDSMDRKK